ncbi:uncharacterized protein LOC144246247 [Lonchura striata]
MAAASAAGAALPGRGRAVSGQGCAPFPAPRPSPDAGSGRGPENAAGAAERGPGSARPSCRPPWNGLGHDGVTEDGSLWSQTVLPGRKGSLCFACTAQVDVTELVWPDKARKIIKLLPSLPEASVFKQPKPRGFSTRGVHWRAPGPAHAVGEPGLAQGLMQVLLWHRSCCPVEPF